MNGGAADNGREQQRVRPGGLLDYDELRQFVRDLVAPLIERLDNLRDEVHEIKRRPQQEAENRRGDVMVICGILGLLIATSSCGSSLLYIGVAIWLHFAR